MLDLERPGGDEELVKSAAVVCLQAASLRGRQAVRGQAEAGEVVECLADPSQPPGDRLGERPQRRGAPGRSDHRQGVVQEPAPLGRRLGQPVGADQRQSLLDLERVLLDRGDDRLLLLV